MEKLKNKYVVLYSQARNDYENLKNLLTTGYSEDIDKYIKEVVQRYGSYTDISPSEVDRTKLKTLNPEVEYNPTYGEMTNQAISQIISLIEKENIEVFCDLGCGRGKIPLLVASSPKIKKSFGVELVSTRYKVLNDIYKELCGKYKDICSKVDIHEGDMFNFDYSKIADGRKTLVFTSNFCFGPVITGKIYDKLKKELPKGSIIVSSKRPDDITGLVSIGDSSDYVISADKLIPEYEDLVGDKISGGSSDSDKIIVGKTGQSNIKMTWCATSVIHFFRII